MWRILALILLVSAQAQAQINSLKNSIQWFDYQQTDSLVTACLKNGYTLSEKKDSLDSHFRSLDAQTAEGLKRNCRFIANDTALQFISWDHFGHAEQGMMDVQLQALRFKRLDARVDGNFITTTFDNGSFIVEQQYEAIEIPGTKSHASLFRYQLYRKFGPFDHLNGIKERYESDPSGKRFLAWKETVRNGVLDGPRIGYYPSGKIRLEENYVNGRLSGKQQEYTESGMLSHSAIYSYNWHYGPEKWYNKDGEVIRSVNWQRDLKTGQEMEKKNGRIVRLINYKQGIPNGKAILPVYSYFQDSVTDFPEMLEEVTFLKGQKNGSFIRYIPDTKVTILSGTYLNNQLHGALRIYGSDGKLVLLENYSNGLKNGASFRYADTEASKEVVLYKQFWKNGVQDSTEFLFVTAGEHTGDTAKIQFYQNNKLYGPSRGFYYPVYDRNNQVKWFPYTQTAQYDEYGLTGNYLLDYPDSIYREGTYLQNKMHGAWISVRKRAGRTDSTRSNYENGLLQGDFERQINDFYSEKGHYVHGLREGTWKVTGDSLQYQDFQTILNYRKGKLDGIRTYTVGGKCVREDSLSNDELIRVRFRNDAIQTSYELTSVNIEQWKANFAFQQQRQDTLISCRLELQTDEVLNHPVFLQHWVDYFSPDVLPREFVRGPVTIETDSLICSADGLVFPLNITSVKYKHSGILQELTNWDGVRIDYFSLDEKPFSGTFYSAIDRCEYTVKNGLLNGWVTYSDASGKPVRRSKFKTGICKKTQKLD